MKRSFFFIFVGALVSLGVWQTTQGLWIYLKADFAQYLLEQAWSKTLKGERRVTPWPWADTWPIGRMLVPKLGVDLIILANANGRTLAFGPGHETISSLPGTIGTTILSGHRDTHFRFLTFLKAGDRIIIQHPNGSTISYQVHKVQTVDAQRTAIHLHPSYDYLVLLTCYPFDALTPGGPLRYVVTALADKPGLHHENFLTPPHRFSHL